MSDGGSPRGASAQVSTTMNEIQEAKIWTMVLLGLVSMILGALPLKLGAYFAKDDRGWKRVVTSVLLCFGGGVLFATSLIHMLPEVILVYSEYYTQNYKSKKDLKNIFVGTRKS